VKNKAAFLLLSIILASCAAKIPYNSNYPLTNEWFHSRDGKLGGKVPEGWFTSTEDTLAPALTVWLIKEDFSAVLTIKELKLDQLTIQQVKKEGLELLARLSSRFQTENIPGQTIAPQEFEVRGKKYCSYEIGAGSQRKRMVVFTSGGKYYECEARAMKGIWTATELTRLFITQQTVLSSLIY